MHLCKHPDCKWFITTGAGPQSELYGICDYIRYHGGKPRACHPKDCETLGKYEPTGNDPKPKYRPKQTRRKS
jgi:hypothetical protein